MDQQTVVVVGTGAAGIVLPELAEQLLALRRQRDGPVPPTAAYEAGSPLPQDETKIRDVLTKLAGHGKSW
jgi:hypothetical protein